MRDSAIAQTWLYGKLQAITVLTDAIGTGAAARAFVAGRVPNTAVFPFVTVQWMTPLLSHPLGAEVSATTVNCDIAVWDQGDDDTTAQTLFSAINDVLEDGGPEMQSGKMVSCALVADLPPAPPPQTPEEPATVRVGGTYEFFIGKVE